MDCLDPLRCYILRVLLMTLGTFERRSMGVGRGVIEATKNRS